MDGGTGRAEVGQSPPVICGDGPGSPEPCGKCGCLDGSCDYLQAELDVLGDDVGRLSGGHRSGYGVWVRLSFRS